MYTNLRTRLFSRRSWLTLSSLFFATHGLALGRSPVGGRLQIRIPWPLRTIDPHLVDDATAAIFGSALFDSLYATDALGNVVPSLAETDPEVAPGKVRIKIRSGLVSASGHALTARDVVASLARARSLGARAWLADVPAPHRVDDRTIEFVFDGVASSAAASKLARTLSSPLTAIVPSSFAPRSPDGTGPMRAFARANGDGWTFARNPKAANGPCFLDEIVVLMAGDLGASLRSFESGTDDVGWLGLGLHEPRKGAIAFDAGACAWALLRTGTLAGTWDAPGIAQRLCDGIAPAKLSYLALGPAWTPDHDEGWGGPPCDLIVREDSPWLVELTRAVAATLSRPSHEVTARPLSVSEFSAKRVSGSYVLAIDVTRPFSKGVTGTLAALATANDVSAAMDAIRHPPRLTDPSARVLTRSLRVGVLGEIRVQGGHVPDLTLPKADFSLDWANVTRGRLP